MVVSLNLQKIEEMPGYDLSQFVADMGGSLGFLLGLSVLGLIGLFEKVPIATLIAPLGVAKTRSIYEHNVFGF